MSTPKKIFFSYSNQNEDLEFYNKIHKHFAAYSNIGMLGIIDKKEIFKLTGDSTKINELLKTSDITIPLLSIDFINDEECLKQLEVAAGEKKVIVPVLLRDFDWEAFKEITQYKSNKCYLAIIHQLKTALLPVKTTIPFLKKLPSM